MVSLYMPTVIAATGAEEWIFGSTDEIRNVFCHFQGFLFVFSTGLTFTTLSVISVDRFLTIVFFDFYTKFDSWKIAHGIMVFSWVRYWLKNFFSKMYFVKNEFSFDQKIN